jgi:O-antigen/teichoic acid export membrane protein
VLHGKLVDVIKHKMSRQMGWAVFGQLVSSLVGLSLIRIYTQTLLPEHYGQLTLILLSVALCQQTIFGPIANGVGRFYSSSKELKTLRSLSRVISKWALVGSTISPFLVSVCLWLSSPEKSASLLGVYVPAFALAIVQGIGHILDSVVAATQRRNIYAGFVSLAAAFRLLFALLFLGSAPDPTPALVVLGLILALCVTSFAQWLWVKEHISATYAPGDESSPVSSVVIQLPAKYRAFVLPFLAWAPLSWLSSSTDRYLVNHQLGAGELSSFQVLYQIGYYPFVAVTNLLAQVLSPLLYQKVDSELGSNSGRARSLNRGLVFVILFITFVSATVVYAVHPFLSETLLPVEYRKHSSMLSLMTINAGLFAAGQQMSFSSLMMFDSASLVKVRIVTTVVTIATTISMGHYFGVVGLVFANMLSGLTYLLILLRRDAQNSTSISPSASV